MCHSSRMCDMFPEATDQGAPCPEHTAGPGSEHAIPLCATDLEVLLSCAGSLPYLLSFALEILSFSSKPLDVSERAQSQMKVREVQWEPW